MKKFYAVLLTILLFCNYVLSAEAASVRVGLADFVDRTDNSYSTSYLTTKINKIFKDALSNSSNNIEVVSAQNSFSNLDEAVISGKSTGCQYIILGALIGRDIDSSQSISGGVFFSSPKVEITTKQSIALDIRIIEVATGKIIFSTSGKGIASYSHSYNTNSTKDMEKFSKSQQEKYEKNLEKAMLSSSSIASEKVCAFLTGEYPKVFPIKDNTNIKTKKSKKKSKKGENLSLGTVKIDRGTSTGVDNDAFYKIFFEGEEVFDLNGDSLGREKFTIAIAQVKNVQTSSCTAEIKGGKFNNIKNEDKAEQITAEEANAIIAQNDFTNSRISEFMN